MFERIVCIFVSLLSLVSVAYSSQHMDITQDNEYATRSNYMDVSFSSVKSTSGTASLTENHQSIVLDTITLNEVGEKEIIQYELYNNSLSYDVEVIILVNGERDYQDGYFHITTSDIGEIKSGERKTGTIEIEYEKASLEDKRLPFNIELQVQQKGYLA